MIRFLLEFIRLDSPTVGNVPIAQIVAGVIIVAFVGILVWRIKTYKAPPAEAAEAEDQAAEAETAVTAEESGIVEEIVTVQDTPEEGTAEAETEADSTT
jgi:hypothetical protein